MKEEQAKKKPEFLREHITRECLNSYAEADREERKIEPSLYQSIIPDLIDVSTPPSNWAIKPTISEQAIL